MSKKESVIEEEFFIDCDMFSVEEIVKICNFYKLIQNVIKKKKYNKDEVLSKYNEYRNLINNKTLEKKYDKAFESRYGVSIYNLMKNLEN